MLYNAIANDITFTDTVNTTKTYKISSDNIQGLVDETEALQQAIYKMLNTKKYEYPIYSFSYGIDFDSLVGNDPVYVKSELKRRISECLLQDERIQSIDNFGFSVSGDSLTCSFKVTSIYGSVNITKEVSI